MSNVSRSVYQKVCEENKRLIVDIHILSSPIHDIFYQKTVEKWRKKFKDENDLHLALKQAATQYLKEHPELNIHNDVVSNAIDNMDDISKHQDKTY